MFIMKVIMIYMLTYLVFNKVNENSFVAMEIEIGGRSAGEIVIELFHDVVPLTANNFKTICTKSVDY